MAYHKITGNESIGSIAAMYGTDPQTLLQSNPGAMPVAGAYLRIPNTVGGVGGANIGSGSRNFGFNVPSLNIGIPNMNPSLSLPGLNTSYLQTPSMTVGARTPSVGVKTPSFSLGVNVPDINIPTFQAGGFRVGPGMGQAGSAVGGTGNSNQLDSYQKNQLGQAPTPYQQYTGTNSYALNGASTKQLSSVGEGSLRINAVVNAFKDFQYTGVVDKTMLPQFISVQDLKYQNTTNPVGADQMVAAGGKFNIQTQQWEFPTKNPNVTGAKNSTDSAQGYNPYANGGKNPTGRVNWQQGTTGYGQLNIMQNGRNVKKDLRPGKRYGWGGGSAEATAANGSNPAQPVDNGANGNGGGIGNVSSVWRI